MRMKFGLLVGFAFGYLMGTKAGRYRYDQIMKVLGKVAQSEPATKARAQATAGSQDDMGADEPMRAVSLP